MNHDLPGPDHWFSENPESLKVWSDSIRSAFRMLGDPIVKPTAAEEKMKVLARRSIIALKDIEEGEVLSVRSIGLRRPGNGMEPAFLMTYWTKRQLALFKRDHYFSGVILNNG